MLFAATFSRARLAFSLLMATAVLTAPPPSTALGLQADRADDLLPPSALGSLPAPALAPADADVLLPPSASRPRSRSWLARRRGSVDGGLELLSPGYLQRPHRRPRQLVAGVGGFSADAILPPGNVGSPNDAQGSVPPGSGGGSEDELLPPTRQ